MAPAAESGMTRDDSTGSLTAKRRSRVSTALSASATSFKNTMSFSSRPGRAGERAEAAGACESECGSDKWETMSGGSLTSKVSIVSASRAALAKMMPSRRSFTSRASATPASASFTEELLPGDHCITANTVTMRMLEDLESEAVSQLPADTELRVLEVSGRRLKVTTGYAEGWISSRTRLDELLVQKRQSPALRCSMDDPVVGGKYEVKAMVPVHLEPSNKSEVKAKLKPGTVVTVSELHPIDRYRVRVSAAMVIGWISLLSSNGSPVVGEPSERNLGREGVVLMPKFMKIKNLLAAAVRGDVEAVRKLVEGRDGWFSGSSADRLSLNSGDVRHKTALMYSAGLGYREVVEYLLSKPEVEINAVDDSRKSALHYASKRGRTLRKDEDPQGQSEIVALLLARGAHLEARDCNGCTAVMFAVANGDEAVTQRLVAAQADLNAKDLEGHSPLDYALNFQQGPMVEFLRQSGATEQAETADASDDEPSEVAASEAPSSETGSASVSATAPAAAGADEVKLKKKKKTPAGDQSEITETPGPEAVKEKKKKADKAGKAEKTGKAGETKKPMAGMMAAVAAEEDAWDVVVEEGPEAEAEAEAEPPQLSATLLESSPSTKAAALAADAEERARAEARAQASLMRSIPSARE